MKTLTLDYNTWRCGGDSKNQLGEGETALQNKKGYQCCLGQFSLQLDKNISSRDLLDKTEPNDLSVFVQALNRIGNYNHLQNTDLSDNAIDINDAHNTTPQEKIVLLKELFLTENYIINVINAPHEK